MNGAVAAGLLFAAAGVAAAPAVHPRVDPGTQEGRLAARLSGLDLHVQIAAARIEHAGLVLEQVRIPVRVHDGGVQVRAAGARLGGGTVRADVQLRTGAGVRPRWTLAAEADGVALEALPWLGGSVQDAHGMLRVDLHGAGPTFASFLGAADGVLVARAGPGFLDNERLDAAGADLLLNLLQRINPFAREQARSRLECVVAAFTVNAGVARAERSIALETGRVGVLGGGTFDLGSGALDLTLHWEAKRALTASAAALLGAVRIGGTLAAPRLAAEGIDPVQAGTAVATAPLSRIAGLLGGDGRRRGASCAVAEARAAQHD